MTVEIKHGWTSLAGIALAVAVVVSSQRMAVAAELTGPAPNSAAAGAAASEMAALGQAYSGEIRPLLERYCHECHSAKRTEAEIDLSAFATWTDVRKQQRVWQKVGEMLDGAQMPPKDARQPSEAQRLQLQQWVRGYLTAAAAAQAGDPGRVVLRRLSNAEYTYTLRDLTGLDSLDPAREFPVDGAAGEGFTNTGSALVMSPALVTKYLDAAKDVAGHAMLVPDGFHFSPFTTPRDWTQGTLAKIRGFYSQFTDAGGGSRVSLQGILIDTNKGGLLPVEKYLAATLAERESLATGAKTFDTVARERGLSAKYLKMVWLSLNGSEPSLVLDTLRTRWRASKREDAAALTADVAAWQKALWTFAKVGQIGKVDGPKSWQEPVTPLTSKQELRFKIPAATDKTPSPQEVTLSLIATDAGDGNEQDFVVWQQPRLVAPGRSDLLLRDVREVTRNLAAQRTRLFPATLKYLLAADEAARACDDPAAVAAQLDPVALAEKHGVEPRSLRAWLDYLGIGFNNSAGNDSTRKAAEPGKLELRGLFAKPIHSVATFDFIQGWGNPDKPFVLANSSDQHVRIPGNMKPHGVAVHPSQKLQAGIGWRSPVTAIMRIEATVTSANAECGNGVSWSLELCRGMTRQRLASGKAQGYQPVKVGPIEGLGLRRGDLVSFLIGSRDGSDSCDLAAVDMELTSSGDDGRTWNLADDVASNLVAANPHDDRFGNPGVWHFYSEVDKPGAEPGWVIPADSLLAKWQTAASAEARRGLAEEIQKLVTAPTPADQDHPNAALHAQLTSFGGPLLSLGTLRTSPAAKTEDARPDTAASPNEWGLDPALFGKHPKDGEIDANSLCVRAPAIITIRLPAEIAAGCELVTTCSLDPHFGAEGSVQLEVVAGQPKPEAGLHPSKLTVDNTNGLWTSDNRRFSYSAPILVNESSAARKRWATAFDDFRQLFPAALSYAKIVPVDEVVTLTQYYREDDQLARLMLNDVQRAELDRLWDELYFVSREPLTAVDALAQLIEFATQDANPKVFEPLREPFGQRAAAFRQRLLDSEPKQLAALVDFTNRVYRRPLTSAEAQDIRALYGKLRVQELPHDEAFRLTLARMLVAPAFLYRVEQPGQGAGQGPISDWELANRLSYFLWSSQPDAELRQAAADGQLREPATLSAQMRRMLRDGKTRRLAIEFGCQWLHIHDFDHLDEKSERHFPTFLSLRGAMYEESIQFFTDLFQNNGSVLDILDADYTFVNAELAKHYGIPVANTASGRPDWFRVSGVRQFGRGGILGQATTLAKQSGASRTSPILRGNWISEVLLGERLPRPPKGVPILPDDESATAGLTVRQLVEKHSSDAKCSVCHKRIDPMGFSLENFDAIGRRREKDSGDRPIETRVTTLDGAHFEGLDGLRNYLLTARRDAFLRQFCRKLLGYSLGRSVQLSDEPLLTEMQSVLKTQDYKIVSVLETIVSSRQFREIRGIDSAYDD